MKSRCLFLAIALAVLLAGCAQPLKVAPSTPVQQLCEQISGDFNNAAQIRALPSSVPRKPSRDGDWIDEQHGRFVNFANPMFGSCSIFLEWRTPDRDGAVTRRRVWSFDLSGEQVVMRFYSFRDESAFNSRDNWPVALAALSPSKMVSYPQGCDVTFARDSSRTWHGRLNAMTCKTMAQRSGREIALGATIDVSPGQLIYSEQGHYTDGTQAFKVPGQASYIFSKE